MASRARITRWLVTSGAVVGIVVGTVVGTSPGNTPIAMSQAWQFHAIVVGVAGTGEPDGADGVDLADVDGDGLRDVAVGYEQGLRLTLSFNPGPADVEAPWPTLELPAAGNLCSAEDVVIGDVDGDGAKDLVAACETGTVRVTTCFAPAPPNTRGELLNPSNWTCVNLDDSAGRRSMRVIVADVAGDSAMELVVGGKESSGPCAAAEIGYYENATPTNQASWANATFEPIAAVGWVMNMYVGDLDGDDTVDVLWSDREPIDCPTPGGANQGIYWASSDGAGDPAWTPHAIVASEGDHKWFDLHDWDGDADLDIIDCRSALGVNEASIWINGGDFGSFTEIPIALPAGVGQCQHATAHDVDDDGVVDLAFSSAQAEDLQGLFWQRVTGSSLLAPRLTKGSVAGVLSTTADTKFDNLAHEDVDGDGDDDWVTTEQHLPNGSGPGLGAGYWENPLHPFTPPAQVACTLLTAGSSTVDGTAFNTASIAPTGGRLLLATVQTAQGAGPPVPTVAGNGATWVQEETVTYSTRRLSVFRTRPASPSAGAVTFTTTGQTQTSAIWQIIECSNTDAGGTDGSAAVPQSVTQTVTANTTLTATLAALAGATSRHLCWVGLDIASNVTPDADLLEISDASVAAGASTLESASALNQVACTPTFSSANAGAIAIEVKAQ